MKTGENTGLPLENPKTPFEKLTETGFSMKFGGFSCSLKNLFLNEFKMSNRLVFAVFRQKSVTLVHSLRKIKDL